MANEVQISAVTGLTITCQLYLGLAAFGAPFSATEIAPLTGEYIASMPANTPYGRYLILASVGSDIKLGSGEMLWGGSEEVDIEYFRILGLDPNNPSTTTPTDWNAGSIDLTLSGDGINITTVTRNP